MKGQNEKSIEISQMAINRLSSYSPTTIKFLCIMLKAFIKLNMYDKIQEVFEWAITIITYNFGVYHPLHSTFNSFLAYYYFAIQDYEKAIVHYQKGLNDCLRILGVDHLLTGQMYLDIANVFIQMDRREEAIRFLEKAFEIFDTVKYDDTTEKASLANQIAVILYDFASYKEAISFAQKSNEIYNVKGDVKYIDKQMDNLLVISKSLERMDQDEEALDISEKIYFTVSKASLWENNKENLGPFIVESLKISLTIIIKSMEFDHR